jgi:hypothetical protein
VNEIHRCTGGGDNVAVVAVVVAVAVLAAVSLMPLYTKSCVSIISRRFTGNAESPTRERHCHKLMN